MRRDFPRRPARTGKAVEYAWGRRNARREVPLVFDLEYPRRHDLFVADRNRRGLFLVASARRVEKGRDQFGARPRALGGDLFLDRRRVRVRLYVCRNDKDCSDGLGQYNVYADAHNDVSHAVTRTRLGL